MGNLAVKVSGLGKEYKIGAKVEQYQTLRDTITDVVVSPFRRARKILSGQAYGAAGLDETIWALRDINFEVKHGEVVGIIGHNGAGKSTLLKVLSRITQPSEGSIDLYGRVGSLLEVGTGFHPELTGRENIYLNGSILGMTRDEIAAKFDEIVDFSGVEKFIDTPLKFYSSGMSLRLGFAVASHLEPEILVVDEVLAVGDLAFQRKCLGKMNEVAGRGRTVLFVSHNMAAVKQLCQRGIVLDGGRVTYDGNVGQAVNEYQKQFETIDIQQESGSEVTFHAMYVDGKMNEPVDFAVGHDVELLMTLRKPMASFRLFAMLENAESQLLLALRVSELDRPELAEPGTYRIHFQIPSLWLLPSTYSLYFKLLPNGYGFKKRYLSDRMMLDGISSLPDPSLSGALQPAFDVEVENVQIEELV